MIWHKSLILLGDLDSFAYVSAQNKAQYPGRVVLHANGPDLAVVKRLILDQIEKLRRNTATPKNPEIAAESPTPSFAGNYRIQNLT